MKIYRGNTKNTAVINAAKAADLSKIELRFYDLPYDLQLTELL
jgi:hypothetical protein